jgi:hypothetical protein
VDELLNIPADLTLLSDQELAALSEQAHAEFERVNTAEEVTAETLERLMALETDLDRLQAETSGRAEKARVAAEREKAKLTEARDRIAARVNGPTATAVEGEVVLEAQAAVDPEAIAAAAARGTVSALVSVLGERGGMDLARISERATASLAQTRAHAPAPSLPKARLSVTAGVDIPGLANGQDLTSLDAMVEAFHKRARGLPVANVGLADGGPVVATIRNTFEHTIDDRTSPGQIDELLRYLVAEDKKEALVAGGGWCAPSEVRYDFFNIACEAGLVDLPTFGVSRGGIRYPVSPSLADTTPSGVFGGFSTTFANSSNPWLWTESDDELTVTGSTNKPCVRIPCPTFDERRLECYGICLTAGNLTDSAYPEATANFLRLLMAAHAHAMNGRIIATMATLSSAAVTGGEFAAAGTPVYNQFFGGVGLAATDYRARYGMCDDDVLEVVAPYWLKATIRADIAHRTGIAPDQVPDSAINGQLAALNVRVQWVNDWQVRGASQFGNATAMTAWPTTATFMIYAAGTFLLGNGLTLDLGVVRDSVLNAENDHTAAWSEECHLVAKVGHESRQYTIVFEVNGTTGAADISDASL